MTMRQPTNSLCRMALDRSRRIATWCCLAIIGGCGIKPVVAWADWYWTCGGYVELRDRTSVPAEDKTCQPAAKGDTRLVVVVNDVGQITSQWTEVWNGAQWVKQ